MSQMDESLQACLEELEAGASAAHALEQRVAEVGVRDALLPLIAIAERYRQAPAALPSIEFRQAARARMLGKIAAQPKARPRSIAWLPTLDWEAIRPARLARIAAAAFAVLFLAVGGGTAALASPPSSPLFGARLALEEAEVLVTPGVDTRLDLRLAIADRRAAELEAMAGTANVDEIALAAQRYESALRGEVDETSAAPEGEFSRVDQRLASQEEMLRRAALAASADAAAAGDVDGAIDAVARERVRLRERHGQNAITPAEPSPEGAFNQGSSAEATPPPEASVTPEPSATATTSAQGSDGLGSDQGRQERAGWDQPGPTPAGNGSTPFPSTSGSEQERNRQQGPSSPLATPVPSPTLAPDPAKPGGSGGQGTSGPQQASTPTGPGSGPGGPVGTQSGTSGGKGGR